MPGRGTNSKGGSRLTASVVAGLLLVPLSAVAAVAIVGAVSGTPSEAAGPEVTSTTATTTSTSTSLATTTTTASADIVAACTVEAERLVALEQNGSISDVQAAALDALRQLCAEHDMTVAPPPSGDPVVRVVTVTENVTTTTLDDSGVEDDDHYGDDDQYEDDDYEDDDHHGDDDEHEDEDHGHDDEHEEDD